MLQWHREGPHLVVSVLGSCYSRWRPFCFTRISCKCQRGTPIPLFRFWVAVSQNKGSPASPAGTLDQLCQPPPLSLQDNSPPGSLPPRVCQGAVDMGRLPDKPGQAGSRRVAMAQFRCWVLPIPNIQTCPMGYCTRPPRPSWECSNVYCSVPPLSAQCSSVCPRFALMLGCDRVQSVIMTHEVLPPPPPLLG